MERKWAALLILVGKIAGIKKGKCNTGDVKTSPSFMSVFKKSYRQVDF